MKERKVNLEVLLEVLLDKLKSLRGVESVVLDNTDLKGKHSLKQ